MKETFRTEGYHIERAVFTEAECKRLLTSLRLEEYRSPPIWGKGAAVVSPCLAAIARNDKLVEIVSELIGDNVILWGVDLILRSPKYVHHWHNDLESFRDNKFVSIWMGLTNTDVDTSLRVIPGSHEIPKPIRQFADEEGVAIEEIVDDKVLRWSGEFNANSRIVDLDTGNGDALFFDGRLWHGSNNKSRFKKRIALLLQYTRPTTPVRIPKFIYNRWPLDYHSQPKPPCLLIRGSDSGIINHIMPGPPADSAKTKWVITTLIEPIVVRPGELGNDVMKSFFTADGPTPDIRSMEIHYSVLNTGKTPHPPHIHDEEEILIIIKGTAELIAEDAKGSNQLKRHPVKPGDYIYYPANWRHTLENTSQEEVVYLMFKWISDEYHSDEVLDCRQIQGSSSLAADPANEFDAEVLLEGKTGYLRKLHSHRSTVKPGGGYDAHIDSYDVAIVLLEGAVETLGETVEAPALIYYAAGEKHGLTGRGDKPAKYIVFEFHGKHGDIYESPRYRRIRKLRRALTDPSIIVEHLTWRIKRFLNK